MQALAPQFPWTAFLEGASLGDRSRFIATTNTSLPKIAAIARGRSARHGQGVDGFPDRRHRRALSLVGLWRCVFPVSPEDARGPDGPKPRWKRGLAAVAGMNCTDAIHLPRHAQLGGRAALFGTPFPAATKASMNALIADLTAAFRARDPKARLDVGSDQGRSAQEARHLHDQGRLSRHAARLFQRRHPPRRPARQRPPRRRRQLGVLRKPQQGAGRQIRLADDAADQQCLQRLIARHRLPGGDPAGADLRSQRRPGVQLWRGRRCHRP